MSNIWSEIRNDYEQEGFIYIDAWTSENEDEGGKVIAKVDAMTKEVHYNDKRAITDKYAQEMIKEVITILSE